ncbi:hypothetical protein EVAR_23728_1 [Eumeta japonica]|uniref:Uncharacterized protein n=1 Tax=Eumeta variegata TaxID=151549 RepID=A0A4C1VGG3_EUMVA|nr:hypothetical protein EVAR_23728_1 [Eumeta japonica]
MGETAADADASPYASHQNFDCPKRDTFPAAAPHLAVLLRLAELYTALALRARARWHRTRARFTRATSSSALTRHFRNRESMIKDLDLKTSTPGSTNDRRHQCDDSIWERWFNVVSEIEPSPSGFKATLLTTKPPPECDVSR